MRTGEVIRTRNVRSYMPDGRSYAEFKPDDAKKREDKRVFVLLVLGTEPLVHDEDQAINVNEWLKARGWTPPPEEDPEVKWEGIPPETRKVAEISKRVHDAGDSHRSNIGGVQWSDVSILADHVGCNGVQLRSIGAKKYRDLLERALDNVGLNLGAVSYEKKGRKSGLLLTVS